MNGRIRELVIQAVMDVDVVTGNETLDDELSKMYIPDCFAERFTELLVQECCFVGEQYADGLLNMKHFDFVTRKIKERLGVQE